MSPARARTGLGLLAVFAGVAAALLLAEWLLPGLPPLLPALVASAAALGAAGLLLRPLERRARELAARCREQDDALHRLQRQRGEWLARIAHDLRTPLATMQGHLELLLLDRGRLEAAEREQYLQTANRQCERLVRMTADLLELTRLEAGEADPRPEPVALAELVQDVAQRFAAEAGRRRLRMDARGEAGTVAALDLAQIERVLQSLIENALEHTPAGGRVALSACCSGGRVRLEVLDDGCGIAPDELPRVFDRHAHAERVGDAGRRPGLGLAIARRIVELHGSRLQLDSAPGRGTRVWFELPLVEPRRS